MLISSGKYDDISFSQSN